MVYKVPVDLLKALKRQLKASNKALLATDKITDDKLLQQNAKLIALLKINYYV